jgi:hypothetical protein
MRKIDKFSFLFTSFSEMANKGYCAAVCVCFVWLSFRYPSNAKNLKSSLTHIASQNAIIIIAVWWTH